MLRLKENPREWQKFVAVIGFAINLVTWLLWWRGKIPLGVGLTAATLALVALVAALVRPHWFRGFYRGGMTLSYQLGQVMGKVILTIFFLLFVTPLGLLLRCLGKDLLQLRRDPKAATWWQPARNNREFDRMF